MMKLQSLQISRNNSWETNSGQLAAKVTLADKDLGSEMTVSLSPDAIRRIINVIAADVQAKAKETVSTVAAGLRESAAPQLEMQAANADDGE